LERKVFVCSTRQGYSRIVKGFGEFAVYRAVQLNPRCTVSTPTGWVSAGYAELSEFIQ
jgi:hypothetical protein